MLAPSTSLEFSVKSREVGQLCFFLQKCGECCVLHKNELKDTYFHLGYKQIGRPVKNLLKADASKTGTGTGERANGGLIECCDISVTLGLTPYRLQMEVPELTEFTQQKRKICPE